MRPKRSSANITRFSLTRTTRAAPNTGSSGPSSAAANIDAREYKRIGKGGVEVWIQASYNPVFDAKGAVRRVVNVATDVTAEKLKNAEFEAKLDAISLAQAVIEFTPAGEIITANANFLATMGYTLDEIKGRHHRMFVDPAFAASPEYQAFWAKLNRGEHVADIFVRIAKGGRKVHCWPPTIPIFDLKGRVTKVVKFATDMSDLIDLGARCRAWRKRPRTADQQAVPADVRRDPARLQHCAGESENDASWHCRERRSGFVGRQGDRDGVRGPFAPHRGAGGEPRGDLGGAQHCHRNGQEDRGRLGADAGRRRRSARQRREGGRRGEPRGRGDGRIEKSSQQISQIIGVIDEIAFQTNLLALNAGVEAARAGDAGKGFAVVASEVRALAQRSAEAAKEIKGLIASSTEEVSGGVKLVAETGEALTQIIDQVGQVNALVGEIASGAEEQATSLHEVNAAVKADGRADPAERRMAEEASAAGTSMLQEAGRLAAMICQFQARPHRGRPRVARRLKQAAPHVFAKPSPTSRTPANEPTLTDARARGKMEPRAPRAKAAVGGDNWNESHSTSRIGPFFADAHQENQCLGRKVKGLHYRTGCARVPEYRCQKGYLSGPSVLSRCSCRWTNLASSATPTTAVPPPRASCLASR